MFYVYCCMYCKCNNGNFAFGACVVKFIYSEKATIFCEISNVDLTGTTYIGQIYGGDFTKFCGLLRIFYELYLFQNHIVAN